jgi:maltose O-acetyltransferase
VRKLLINFTSIILSKIYNLLYASAKYRYIKKIQKRYPDIKTEMFHLDTYIYGDGNISIGEGSYFGKGTFIYSDPKDANIKIGKNCMISHNVQIRTLTYDESFIDVEPRLRKYKFGDIFIGDNVWIGANVFIKNGIKIGNNVIIGTGSVVTKSLPDNVIVHGVPARIIRERKVI